MNKLLCVLGLLAGFPLFALAQTHQIMDGFVVLNPAGAGNTFFDTDEPTANPDFTGTVATIQAGQALLLGGEVESDRTVVSYMGSQEVAADAAAIHYAVDAGSTNSLNLPKVINGPIDRWQETNVVSMVDVGAGLDVGSHTLRIFFTATDLNHPLAGTVTRYLPTNGVYTAMVQVTEGPTGTFFACDDASDAAYDAGWTNGSNGGTGFGPWDHQFVTDPDGAAGIFLADAVGNTDLNNIGTGPNSEAWGLFANEAGTGGNDIQIVGARRDFDTALTTGQVFGIQIEHGGIQSGNLNAGAGPRDGGWVGFVFNPTPSNFPDPIDPLTAISGQFGFGFKGGNADYSVYDLATPSGRSTGVPFTDAGVDVSFELTSTTTYDLRIKPLPNGPITTIGGSLSGASLTSLGVFNRNAEQDNAYFNSICVEDAPVVVTNRLACDDAAQPVYATEWTNGMNGGFGFEPWLFLVAEDGGAAGTFTATNPPNTDLNEIAIEGLAWGMFANDSGVGGVQVVQTDRAFSQGELKKGQTFSVKLEHGGVDGVNGEVELILRGTPTFPNPMGEVYTFQFVGGGTNYTYADAIPATTFPTAIPFTDQGLQVDFTLTSDVEPYTYGVRVETFGTVAGEWVFSGEVESPPRSARLKITDVEVADVFWNKLAIIPAAYDLDGDTIPNDWEAANGTDPNVDDASADDDGDGDPNLAEYIADTAANDSNDFFRVDGITIMSPAEISFDAATGRLYTVEYDDNLLTPDDWQVLSNNVAGVAGALIVSDPASTNQRNYRVRVRLAD